MELIHIDLDNFHTKATRALDKEGPALKETIAGLARMATQSATRFTSKAQALEAARKINPQTTASSKMTMAQLREAYAAEVIAFSDPASQARAELNRLEQRAREERYLAQAFNKLLDTTWRKYDQMREKANESLAALTWRMSLYADDLQTHVEAARYINQVTRELADPDNDSDFSELVESLARELSLTLRRFPRAVQANGLSGVQRAEGLYAALAADMLLDHLNFAGF